MLEIFFTINGIDQKEIAVFYDNEDLKYFVETYKEQVLEQYPTATNIRLGDLSTSLNNYNA
ncbi:hypothetical protein [Flavobacterium phage V157]|uniref:Uncharacterized protein n=19 Tax=Ficleduovirus TaxID=2560131 RepID=A0A7G8L461_9CAUD|nr:hypothetical protein FDG55_gp73 [Flavobacterium phage FCV-1]ASD51655.1 hypothetical protein [Flavobacterium phage FCV-3]ASD51729.1 hypothetical protein [Flavobacterium phage FCV-11]ASD51806.1 hypothetical protein [Flavobacterium phage V175]ASD51883.1 hypothetical protein [Flavobacterium phage V181]ASD52558.1 hypothetical protein [Flavobacterium phage FCV-10]ASD52632.1 hypothetical protein [Flavobacterium phage FCV-16]ASD52706.1 hypothetical protein [Flavobacterium phage FCV-20]ASD52782.1